MPRSAAENPAANKLPKGPRARKVVPKPELQVTPEYSIQGAEEQNLYIRNLTYCPIRVRTSNRKNFERDYELKPRGSREDMLPVLPEDERIIFNKANEGLYEILSESEANDVIVKQNTNSSEYQHPAHATLNKYAEQNEVRGGIKRESSAGQGTRRAATKGSGTARFIAPPSPDGSDMKSFHMGPGHIGI